MNLSKNDIIGLIRRCAERNGGKPVGQIKFSMETGVKESEWNRYWPRFSDAIAEAGLSPPAFYKPAYSETELLSVYADFALELNRLPTEQDLIHRRKNKERFPNESTFRAHFGSKAKLVEKLIEFCQGKPQFDEILGLCREYSLSSSVVKLNKVKELQAELGSVYLLKSGKMYKIGKTNAVGRRMRELEIQLPIKPKLVHKILTDDPSGIEKYWHDRFSDKRKGGEWFELDQEDVAAFRRRKFQ